MQIPVTNPFCVHQQTLAHIVSSQRTTGPGVAIAGPMKISHKWLPFLLLIFIINRAAELVTGRKKRMGSGRDHSRAVRAELTLGDQAQRQLLSGIQILTPLLTLPRVRVTCFYILCPLQDCTKQPRAWDNWGTSLWLLRISTEVERRNPDSCQVELTLENVGCGSQISPFGIESAYVLAECGGFCL
jgi:hypothetical protein